ncbi:MAG: hypothetical protein JWO44_1629 [Bacteroidetes bacterium]|nr:hypothetical protein [Bacteroidota bacterium]
MLNVIYKIKMSTVFKKSGALAILLLMSAAMLSQNWKKDLLEMNKAYMNAKSFSMKVDVNSYAGLNDKKAFFRSAGEVVSSGSNYYTSMMGRITILNERCMLVVDHGQKMIVYKKNNPASAPRNGFTIASLDSSMVMMEKNVKVKYLQDNAKEKRIELTYKSGEIARMEIVLDPVTCLMREVVFYYNTSKDYGNSLAKVVVTYTDTELDREVPDSFFSENNFLVSRKNEMLPLKKYEKYEVVNQSHSKS